MRTLKYLLQKEFRQIFRNSIILRMIIAVPIVQLLIIPLTADYEVKNINISVVDHDHSTYSRQMIQSITASGYFKLIDYGESFKEAFSYIEKDEADLILEIPVHFEKNIMRSESPSVFVAVNAINGMKAQVGNGYLGQIIKEFNRKILIMPSSGQYAAGSNQSVPTIIDIKPTYWFNPTLSYPFFMVPGILVILVTMVGAYMSALNI